MVVCPSCGNEIYERSAEHNYKCEECGKEFFDEDGAYDEMLDQEGGLDHLDISREI
ncbi:hypothetical protein ACFLZ9_02145 [Patescibacteria group bacterium]